MKTLGLDAVALGAEALNDPPPGTPGLPQPARALVCRRMTDADIADAVALLAVGFPYRSAAYWLNGLGRLRARDVPAGCPRYGYVLSDQGRLVGILLVIFAVTDEGHVRGNVSSWYVDPQYRGFSHMLLSAPSKLKDVTLFNISPAPSTIATIQAQGFAQYVGGTFIALAACAPHVFGARVQLFEPSDPASSQTMRDHSNWGCLCLEVAYRGETYPFVFVARRFAGGRAQGAQLVYCRDVKDFLRFAGPLGRRLMKRGLSAVFIDANGPFKRLPGLFRPQHSPKFSRGIATPRLGDLSYTELAIFGP